MKPTNLAVRDKAFTLVELLTVLFITAILMTIIVVPMIHSFNFVRAGQAFSDAQSKGRALIERISREIGNGAGVRDNSGFKGACDVVVPGLNGTPTTVRMLYTKLDIWKPAQEGPVGANGFINPDTGKIDPTLKAPKGQIVLPVAPGATLVRYWVALRNPFYGPGYVNPYDGLLMARTGVRDNLYVLYRAEVQPMVPVNGVLQPNVGFFAVSNGQPVLDDPSFFVWDGSDPGTIGTKGNRIQNWRNKATIVTEVSRYDMIAPVYDKSTRQVFYDGNMPRLLPLIQFRPVRVSSEPATGQEPVRQSEESEGMNLFAPDVYKTKLWGWSNTLVRVWPGNWLAGQPYEIARPGGSTNVSIFRFDPSGGGDELLNGTELFDITGYEQGVAGGAAYPFSQGLLTANLTTQPIRNSLVPFFLDPQTGRIVASFGIWEVGTGNVKRPDNNLPFKLNGSQTTPTNAGPLPGNLSAYPDINDQFNKVWQDYPDLRPNVHRFIDLRVTPNADGTPSPLNPDPLVGFSRAMIVPGSEVVIGPDQYPGPNYGSAIRYTRTTHAPGPNQYRVNYVNLAEPTDWTLLGFPNPPATYDANNVVSAILQPRYKAGYIQLNSDPTVPLPNGNITVQYRFQFTRQSDTLAVDYDSRNVMQILLTIKNYPQTSDPNPQGITLKASATVRNYLR